MGSITHSLLVTDKDVMKLPFTDVCNTTHRLLVIGKEMAFHKNVY